MAPRKKDLAPLPDTVWFARGMSGDVQSPQVIGQRLAEQAEAGTVENYLHYEVPGDEQRQQMFDTRWCPQDSTTVRARLTMSTTNAGRVWTWRIAAEANQPWDWSWPTPLTVFWPKALDSPWDIAPYAGGFPRYRRANTVESPGQARAAVRAAGQAQADIHVLTTLEEQSREPVVPLVRHLPAGLLGRLVEYRVAPEALSAVNRELRSWGLQLPPGGAVIVPPRTLRPRPRPAELTVAEAVFIRGRPQALIDAVMRHVRLPRLGDGELHQYICLLRESFLLLSHQEAAEELEEDLDAARRTQEELREELKKTKRLLHEAREDVRAGQTREGKAAQTLRELQDELQAAREDNERLQRTVAGSTLAGALREAEEGRDAAERETEEAWDLLDEQNREITWLRSLVSLGQTSSASQDSREAEDPPASWEEINQRTAADLKHIVLGDITAPIRRLCGHVLEPTWRQRTWQALRALDAYARAKSEHGPQKLPHLTAYLLWRQALVPLPRTWYSANESQLVLTTPKLRAERMFPVPREVHPTGRILMTEHIRIGSGQPPAPRLYFFDHTSHNGLIYVGYIGEHLRNSRTN